VSKLPALPAGTEPAEAAAWMLHSAERSRQRLGSALDGLLLHRAEDLLDPAGDAIWRALAQFSAANGVRLGVSCYEPAVLAVVLARYPLALAQIPGNALDQRLAGIPSAQIAGVELHLRSAFLQGLLLLPEDVAQTRLPAATQELRHWHRWLAAKHMVALDAALALVKGLPRLGHCVVGVDSLSQLDAIIAVWDRVQPMQACAVSGAICTTCSIASIRLHRRCVLTTCCGSPATVR